MGHWRSGLALPPCWQVADVDSAIGLRLRPETREPRPVSRDEARFAAFFALIVTGGLDKLRTLTLGCLLTPIGAASYPGGIPLVIVNTCHGE